MAFASATHPVRGTLRVVINANYERTLHDFTGPSLSISPEPYPTMTDPSPWATIDMMPGKLSGILVNWPSGARTVTHSWPSMENHPAALDTPGS